MKEEIFGPILPVLSFEKLDDIDNIINKNPNPLALYVFSNNKNLPRLLSIATHLVEVQLMTQ